VSTRCVVLTGASGGVGVAARAALEAAGATVVGVDLAPRQGDVAVDVRDAGSVDRGLKEAAERLGGIDVLVNNAGIAAPCDAGVAPGEAALAILDVNLLGAWRCTAAALPLLRERRGRVVNVASGLSFANLPLGAAYCASKRALAAYSDVLRLEYAGQISVATVYPMFMKTGLHGPGERAGLFLDGLLREERVEDAARAIVRAALGPEVRDVATTRLGWLELAVARHVPELADRVVAWRVRRAARRGTFADSPVARPLAARVTGA
jgi:NAD(P)-dependent dehydrogenase (short-subunit alcohol dehydrogenase family)